MAGTSFSLTEKLAVTGAFLALVTMVVGTEDDPGLVVTGQDAVKEMRSAPAIPAAAPSPSPLSAEPQPLVPSPPAQLAPPEPVTAAAQTPQPIDIPAAATGSDTPADIPGQFSPTLGRVPRDFSKGPPG